MQLLASVKKIYDQYLAPSSPHTVNVDDRVLKAVEAKLSNPPLNIFAEAQEQVSVRKRDGGRSVRREKERERK